jgi:TIR domain
MSLFLSYVGEDAGAAEKIAHSLRDGGLEVYHFTDPAEAGSAFTERIEDEINRADAFVALVSPDYFLSFWCRRERELAMFREHDLGAGGRRPFIHVVEVAKVPYENSGYLRKYAWFDMTTPRGMDEHLPQLVSKLRGEHDATAPARPVDRLSVGPSPKFRNRRDEMDKILRGLTNASGPHFWQVVGPAQLGKSWFIDRMGAELGLPESAGEPGGSRGPRVNLVDLREQGLDARSNVSLLLARLSGTPAAPATSPPDEARQIREIAQQVIEGGRLYVCVLDSAELLEPAAAKELRARLSKIYEHVQSGGRSGARFAFVVSGRREEDWRGVVPDPRLSLLELTEFSVDVIREALDHLARTMDRTFPPAELRRTAERVRRLTEGLPALLVRALRWIQREGWVDLDRLANPEVFAEVARAYIDEELLSVNSLFPSGGRELSSGQAALAKAFQALAPYRLFTRSHVVEHLGLDAEFARTVAAAGWSTDDLLSAIDGTALLRPLHELWQVIHPAIRRLLYRHYYACDSDRVEAHGKARKFVEVWMDQQYGTEQVVGLVECLWHEAAIVQLERPEALDEVLTRLAGHLCDSLKPSRAYTISDLRARVERRISADEELQQVLSGVPGLADRLAQVVLPAPEGRA